MFIKREWARSFKGLSFVLSYAIIVVFNSLMNIILMCLLFYIKYQNKTIKVILPYILHCFRPVMEVYLKREWGWMERGGGLQEDQWIRILRDILTS